MLWIKSIVRHGRRPTLKLFRPRKHIPEGEGHLKADNHDAQTVAAAKAKAETIRNFAFALVKNLEHLTENQQTWIALIAENNSRLYQAYHMKVNLRLLLKIKDIKKAEGKLNQ